MAETETRTIERLRAGAGTYACGGYLGGLGTLQRTELCTTLIFDRLSRKMRMVEALRSEAADNWNQTFYPQFPNGSTAATASGTTSRTSRPSGARCSNAAVTSTPATTTSRWRARAGKRKT